MFTCACVHVKTCTHTQENIHVSVCQSWLMLHTEIHGLLSPKKWCWRHKVLRAQMGAGGTECLRHYLPLSSSLHEHDILWHITPTKVQKERKFLAFLTYHTNPSEPSRLTPSTLCTLHFAFCTFALWIMMIQIWWYMMIYIYDDIYICKSLAMCQVSSFDQKLKIKILI